jgi:4-hydroxy-tetrahydrodipicolinate reductase
MGQEVEKVALERGHEIEEIFTDVNPLVAAESLAEVEMLIDFSQAEVVQSSTRVAARAETPIVEGTTGWYEDLDAVLAERGLTMLYSPNFSIGVMRFVQLVKNAAALLKGYDCYVHEFHHRGKADSPSGTALKLAQSILEFHDEKKEVLSEAARHGIAPQELHVTSTRIGRYPGTHEVGFDSDSDTIQLRHTAHGRRGFAEGAVVGAEWLLGRKGVYTMGHLAEALDGELE